MTDTTVPSIQNRPQPPVSPVFPSLPPLSLYVHFPWCVRKCAYCDFNSHPWGGSIDEKAYLDALNADLESALPLIEGRSIVSVFIGGGTPSLLSVEAVDALLSNLRQRLPLLADLEITLEANPGTVEAGKFQGFRAAGITRLSLGVQSFDTALLQRIGRIHDGPAARRAAALASENFSEVNFDLIYGLPGQTLAQALSDIETAVDYSPTHLSAYQLTLEPNTLYAVQPPEDLPDEETMVKIEERIDDRLHRAGFERYEVSAFARPGHECRHNLNYWQFGDYLGIGPGAHSKLTGSESVLRQVRWKNPPLWLAARARTVIDRWTFLQDEKIVTCDELPFEFVMNALRLTQGFAPELFQERTGLPLTQIIGTVRQAVTDGLLEMSPARIRPTERGRRYLNSLLCRF